MPEAKHHLASTLLTMFFFFKGTIFPAFSRGISAHFYIKLSINYSLKSFDLVTAVNVC